MSERAKKADSQGFLRVGEVAEKVGLTSRAIRYYEELNLLGRAARTEGGFRIFGPEDIHRLETISALQGMGMPLAQIRELAQAWAESKTGRQAAERLKDMLQKGLAEAQERQESLRKMESAFQEALTFMGTCTACDDQPEREGCQVCTKGSHHAHLPELIDTFMHKERAAS